MGGHQMPLHGPCRAALGEVIDGLARTRYLSTSSMRLRGTGMAKGCWGTSWRTSAPLLPQGLDPRERHHCGPSQYIGKTPVQIVARFKDQAIFPWYRLPESLRERRFEELWQLAHRVRHKAALEAVRLLTDESFDRAARQTA